MKRLFYLISFSFFFFYFSDNLYANIISLTDCNVTNLISAINTANANGQPENTINLPSNCTYHVTTPDNTDVTNGSSGFPRIISKLSLNGNGSTLQRTGISKFRFFYVDKVGGNGNLSLYNLTLKDGDSDVFKGGALLNVKGLVTLVGVNFIHNTSAQSGGAVANLGGGMYIHSSYFEENVNMAGGGGAVANLPSGLTAGAITINASTFSHNTSTLGGGAVMSSLASLFIANSTFFGNVAGNLGGGALNAQSFAPVFILNSTIASNTSPAGKGAVSTASSLRLKNTLISNNSAGGNCVIVGAGGSIVSNGNNLDDDGTCLLNQISDKSLVESKLDLVNGLGFDGRTIPLLSDSPAIDAGDPAECVLRLVSNVEIDLTKDARGVARFGTCDMGAYEFSCGNGSIEGNEQCDDAGGCCDLTTCQFKPQGTICDDGDGSTRNDQCNNAGTCAGTSSTCGDRLVNAGETCDDGNTVNGDGCSSTCQTEPQAGVPVAVCGNKTKEGGEQCDDGNTKSGDGCSSTCQTEPQPGVVPKNSGSKESGGCGLSKDRMTNISVMVLIFFNFGFFLFVRKHFRY